MSANDIGSQEGVERGGELMMSIEGQDSGKHKDINEHHNLQIEVVRVVQ